MSADITGEVSLPPHQNLWCGGLQEAKINRNTGLLINPENVFWALIFGKGPAISATRKIHSLYARYKKKLDAAMHEFRFAIALNSVYINPTDRCNADCPYCYIPESKRKYGESMSHSQLEHILNKVDKYFAGYRKKYSAKPVIIYHGSEPLLVKKILFSSILRFGKRFHFGIQTNASLLTQVDAEFLKLHNVSVGISLDSFNEETNNYTRRIPDNRSFDKAIQAIDWFSGYEGLSVITTITRYNVKDLTKLVRFLHTKRVGCVLLNPVRATRKAVLKLRPDEEKLTDYFIRAVTQAARLSKSSQNNRIIIGNFSNIILGIIAPQARRLMCDISPCGGGRCFFAITAGGEMIPCGEFIGLKEFYGGNIFSAGGGSAFGGKDIIEQAIQSKPFKKLRERIAEKISECEICLYRNICGAPCPAEVYSLSKNLNTKSPYCEFYKKIIDYAFKLIAEGEIEYFFHKDAVEDIKYEYKLSVWSH
jgi:uncharacterized protein